MTDADQFDVFEERDSLRAIRDYARQHMAGPFAVLFLILMRACVSVGPVVRIPAIVGTPKPLNMIIGVVGASGFGKGIADDVAENYWPTPDVPVYPFGSGEGTTQAFDPDDDGQPRQPKIIFTTSEVDAFKALSERSGSILLPTVRQIGTGDQLGQKNASKATTRIVNKRSYAAGMSLAIQNERAGVLIDDAAGGTPQRICWAPATDADAPENPPTDVNPWQPSTREELGTDIQFPPCAYNEIRAHRHRVLTGDQTINPLDGHAYLTRCKVAAGLMIIDGRAAVSEDDWRVAGRLMEISDRTRAGLIAATEQAARIANRTRALASADRDEVVASTKLHRTKQTLLKHLGRKKELPRHELRKRLRSDQREFFDAAISELADEGRVVATEDGHSTVYRTASSDTGESTWTQSPRPNLQLNGGGQKVHVDHADNVMQLETRRSHDHTRPKVSAAKWFANHIADLVNAGHATAESFAVYQAGEAAGYTVNNLRQAASAHPYVTVAAKAGRTVTWSITPPQQTVGEAS